MVWPGGVALVEAVVRERAGLTGDGSAATAHDILWAQIKLLDPADSVARAGLVVGGTILAINGWLLTTHYALLTTHD